jgi:hypothetical protein
MLVLLLVLLRLPFAALPVLPFYLEFNPAIILVPVFAVLWGAPGAFGGALGVLAGDALCGMWNSMTPWRVTGTFLYGLLPWILWESRAVGSRLRKHAASWPHAIRFLLTAIPGAFLCAAMYGLGSQFNHIYPFGYLSMLTLFHHLFFLLPAGPLLYRFLSREQKNLERDRSGRSGSVLLSRRRALLLMYLGAYGAAPAGWAAEWLIYGRRWNQVHMIGEYSGSLVTGFVWLFLAVLAVGVIFRHRPAA